MSAKIINLQLYKALKELDKELQRDRRLYDALLFTYAAARQVNALITKIKKALHKDPAKV